MSQPLQTITAKVHFQIKDMIVNECARLNTTESAFLNYYLDKSIRQEKELAQVKQDNHRLRNVLEEEKLLNADIKLIENSKSSKRKETEQILESNEAILASLYTQHGNKPIAGVLFKEAGFRTSHFTQYETAAGEKSSIYWQYDYGFKNLGNNQFTIIKR
jgi:hypothetical protein